MDLFDFNNHEETAKPLAERMRANTLDDFIGQEHIVAKGSLLRRAIATELADTTTVIVAQRVSSVMSCDLILVIDEGRIIGAGYHDTLMQTCSVYSEISNSQMGGAILE